MVQCIPNVLDVAILRPGNMHAPSGSFVTMYLAEIHLRNGYMEIGLLISSLHGNTRGLQHEGIKMCE